MQVFVPKTSGFCPGVKRAEDGVFHLRKTSKQVNLHGPLIHNQDYINMLQENQIQAVDINTLASGDTLVIRTHGISRHEENELKKTFTLQDLTCPIVKRVQKHIEKSSQENAFVIISGKANHAEVQGLISYTDHALVIENQEELNKFLEAPYVPDNCTKIFILSQTTHSREFFQELCEKITNIFENKFPIEIKNTICPITENKEQESLTIQKDVDFTIVIGDPNSSNSKKLYNILVTANSNTIFTKNLTHLKELKSDWTGIEKVLVVSSTSTPLFIEKEITDYLQEL